jgi:hypothetical protein
MFRLGQPHQIFSNCSTDDSSGGQRRNGVEARSEQKRRVIAMELRDDPVRSNRAVAEAAHVDHKTVAAVRRDLEVRGEIPHTATAADRQGRVEGRGEIPHVQPLKEASPKIRHERWSSCGCQRALRSAAELLARILRQRSRRLGCLAWRSAFNSHHNHLYVMTIIICGASHSQLMVANLAHMAP